MFRKITSIFFYILGGFFTYMVCLLAFINIPRVGALKFAIMGGFCIPALFFLTVGAATSRLQNWKSSIGITLLSGVGFNLLVIITFISFLLTPEIKEFFPDNTLTLFNDYFSGFSVMSVLAVLGVFLVKTNKGKNAESGASPNHENLGSTDE